MNSVQVLHWSNSSAKKMKFDLQIKMIYHTSTWTCKIAPSYSADSRNLKYWLSPPTWWMMISILHNQDKISESGQVIWLHQQIFNWFQFFQVIKISCRSRFLTSASVTQLSRRVNHYFTCHWQSAHMPESTMSIIPAGRTSQTPACIVEESIQIMGDSQESNKYQC